MADVLLIYKKDPLNKDYYRPVSLPSYISKVLERLLYEQTERFMSNELSNKLFGFCENYNTQYSLADMLEK